MPRVRFRNPRRSLVTRVLLLAGALIVGLGTAPTTAAAQIRDTSNYARITNGNGTVWQSTSGPDRTKDLATSLAAMNNTVRAELHEYVRWVYLDIMPLMYGQRLKRINNLYVSTDDDFSISYRRVSDDVVSFTLGSSKFNVKAKLVNEAGTRGWPRLNRDLDVHGRYTIKGQYNVKTGRVSGLQSPQVHIDFITVRTRKIDGDQRNENWFLQTVFLQSVAQMETRTASAASRHAGVNVPQAFRVVTQATSAGGFSGAVVRALMTKPENGVTNSFSFTQSHRGGYLQSDVRELGVSLPSNIRAIVGTKVVIENCGRGGVICR